MEEPEEKVNPISDEELIEKLIKEYENQKIEGNDSIRDMLKYILTRYFIVDKVKVLSLYLEDSNSESYLDNLTKSFESKDYHYHRMHLMKELCNNDKILSEIDDFTRDRLYSRVQKIYKEKH